MEYLTIGIVIGVSNYSQEEITPLPAAQNDAINFTRSIRNWGIPEPNLFLFLDPKKKTLDDFFIHLSEIQEEFRLIFYFCGHGHRSSDALPKSYLLFNDSSLKDGQYFNTTSLDLIIEKINKLNSLENYIFIDACYLRINRIKNPKLEDEIRGDKFSRKTLLCLLSSGIQPSFESEREKSGYFTEALLKSLCEIRNTENSPSQLLKCLHKELEGKDLSFPEMYSIGTQKISFLHPPLPSFSNGKLIFRAEFIAQIQDILIQNRTKILSLFGESGIGKSSLCQSLASDKLKIFYISIPSTTDDSFNLPQHIVNSINNRFSSITNIHELSETFPHSLIIVDQLERVGHLQLELLFKLISKLNLRFICVSTDSLKNVLDKKIHSYLVEIEMPPFSKSEGKELIRMIKPTISETEIDFIHLAAQGNPLKIKKILSSPNSSEPLEYEEELKKAIAAVYSSGMYINESLFTALFDLNEKALSFLQKIGLIECIEGSHFPHFLLDEIAELESLTAQKEDVLNYWYQQLDELPNHARAAQHFIFIIRCFGYEKKADPYLGTAFLTLYRQGRYYLEDLIQSVDIFDCLTQMTQASLLLTEVLIEWGELEISDRLLKKNIPKELEYRARLSRIQKMWRAGDFQESIRSSTEALQLTKTHAQQIRYYFHRGIAHFLNGQWNEAFFDFTFVYEQAREEIFKGRAQCMLGTIIGMRGIDIALGKKHLEIGSNLLAGIEDIAGLWTGWNNLGEILWKCGEHKLSSFYLEKALELSHQLNDENVKIETLRNLLNLHSRWESPFSTQASDFLACIENTNWRKCGTFEKTLTLNTLSTVYLFRRDIERALTLLRGLHPWTSKNNLHHIYTLSNLSFLSRFLSREDKSQALLQKAISLAQTQENFLAIHQIKTDFTICFKVAPF